MTDVPIIDTSPTDKKKKTSSFKEDNLTIRAHVDPDKHWIGETLPAGSDKETTSSGIVTSAGNSPFPARADHSHDHKTYYSTYTGGACFIPPGQQFVGNWVLFSGKNMLALGSQSVIIFPEEGIWDTRINMTIERLGGGYFVGEMNVMFYYSNGGYARPVYRASMYDLPGTHYVTCSDSAHYPTVSSANNVQVAIQQSDAANWNVYTNYIEVTRLHSYGSA